MAVRKIFKMGHSRLLRVSKPVTEFNTPELDELIEDMFETMDSATGAGLAAPQVGVLKRVIVYGFDTEKRDPGAPPVPRSVLINPEIEPLTDEFEENWEGCLSLPGMQGAVPRWKKVRYKGFDQKGNPVEGEAGGFHARVLQHECDHLDGILYPMRMLDLDTFGFSEAFEEDEDPEELE